MRGFAEPGGPIVGLATERETWEQADRDPAPVGPVRDRPEPNMIETYRN